jgi:hypothetical protein
MYSTQLIKLKVKARLKLFFAINSVEIYIYVHNIINDIVSLKQ